VLKFDTVYVLKYIVLYVIQVVRNDVIQMNMIRSHDKIIIFLTCHMNLACPSIKQVGDGRIKYWSPV
jgi:hypothetical protein